MKINANDAGVRFHKFINDSPFKDKLIKKYKEKANNPSSISINTTK